MHTCLQGEGHGIQGQRMHSRCRPLLLHGSCKEGLAQPRRSIGRIGLPWAGNKADPTPMGTQGDCMRRRHVRYVGREGPDGTAVAWVATSRNISLSLRV